MKILIILLFLSGCVSVSYEGRFGKISRTAFGTDLAVGKLTVDADPGGHTKITVENGGSTQSESIKAAAEGAANGAIKAMK